MRILIASDKFKGSLPGMEVCQAIAEGLQQTNAEAEIILHPMADGGDGSLAVLARHLKLTKQKTTAADPLGRPINTFYYTSKNIAFIELAKASGIVLLHNRERNPLKTSTYGSGQQIADALSKGYNEIYLFLGGSATNDGGMGIATALGAQFYDKVETLLEPSGENMSKVESIQLNPVFDLEKTKITLLCDVKNPLYGPNGAAHIYARQKGADDQMIQLLDKGLQHFSEKLKTHTGLDVALLPGCGAAGGVAAALVALFGARLKSGIECITELTNLEAEVQRADIVISGEGKLDLQSFEGKVIDGVAQLCKQYEKPLFLFVGKNELSDSEQMELGAKKVYAVFEVAADQEDAMKETKKYLKQLARKWNTEEFFK